MIVIFFLIGFLLFFLNINKWEINVKLLLILFPFFGLIANNLEPYSSSRITSIFYDFVFIIPIYLSLFTKKLDYGYFSMMPLNLKFAFFFIFLIILIQLLNPYNSIPF